MAAALNTKKTRQRQHREWYVRLVENVYERIEVQTIRTCDTQTPQKRRSVQLEIYSFHLLLLAFICICIYKNAAD